MNRAELQCWVLVLMTLTGSALLGTAAARAQDRLGSRRHELGEARDALREARSARACFDRVARVRRAQTQLEAAAASADRSQRRRLQDARERLQDCLYDHSDAAGAVRRGTPTPQTRRAPPPRTPPRTPPIAPRVTPVRSSLPTVVTAADGSLLNSGPVLADLRARAADVRGCVAANPANIRSPFRMTLTLFSTGRYGELRVPASASPALVQCMARAVPHWQIAGPVRASTFRVDVHLSPPRASASRPVTTPRPQPAPTVSPRVAPTPPVTTAPASTAGRVHLLNARNQRVSSGAVLRDLDRRANEFQTCATQHPSNVPPLLQMTITLNSTGQLVSVRLPSGLDVAFEGCVLRQTVAWRVDGATSSDAGLYAITVRLR